MQISLLMYKNKTYLLLALFLPFAVMAEENLTLKDVMQGLNTDLREVTYGIVMEDYDLVAKSAQAIADHPTPDPALLKKIVAHLGAEMPQFKGFDQQVHDTALELKKAAMAQDKEALLEHYNEIIRGCVGCHQSYRKSISDLLNN
jgi:hypothetical protein